MWIEREWAPAVGALSRRFPAVLLTGPRQVGKTSLLRHQFSQLAYVTFDDPALARQAETQPETFFAGRPEPLLLDEVQYAPALFRHLKKRIDEDRRPGRFLLTGSQKLPLMQNATESLAGRCGVLEMNSLAYREARGAVSELDDIDFLVRGGFPELYSVPTDRPADWYSSYVATYLERDVRNARHVGDLRDFSRFLRACALRSGQLLSFSDLARDVGVAPNTARAWLSVLQASGQVFLLEPYHRSAGKRLVKAPKLYFLDTGLACHLVGIADRATLFASPLAGAFWETFVVGQIVRHFQVSTTKPPIWFWRTSQGDEVDVLVEYGKRFVAIECKLTELPDQKDTKQLQRFARDMGQHSLIRSIIACRTIHAHDVDGGVLAASVLDVLNALRP
jgi:predicted AAA+ superfamily ATPase